MHIPCFPVSQRGLNESVKHNSKTILNPPQLQGLASPVLLHGSTIDRKQCPVYWTRNKLQPSSIPSAAVTTSSA